MLPYTKGDWQRTKSETIELRDVETTAQRSIMILIHDDPFPVTNVSEKPGKLIFTFDPGVPVTCQLTENENGNYSGTCKPDENNSDKSLIKLTMIPPPLEELATDEELAVEATEQLDETKEPQESLP